jgi:hypothetical protein
MEKVDEVVDEADEEEDKDELGVGKPIAMFCV